MDEKEKQERNHINEEPMTKHLREEENHKNKKIFPKIKNFLSNLSKSKNQNN